MRSWLVLARRKQVRLQHVVGPFVHDILCCHVKDEEKECVQLVQSGHGPRAVSTKEVTPWAAW